MNYGSNGKSVNREYELFNHYLNCDFTCSQLFNLLSEVRTDPSGVQYIPQQARKRNLEKTAKKLVFPTCQQLTKLVFGPDASVAKYQHLLNRIREKWARDIVRHFPTERLLDDNPLRKDGGEELFERFYRAHALRYLSELFDYKSKKESGSKKRIPKKEPSTRRDRAIRKYSRRHNRRKDKQLLQLSFCKS